MLEAGGVEALLKVLLKCEADAQQQQRKMQQQQQQPATTSTGAFSTAASTATLRSRVAAALMAALDGNAGAAQAVVDVAMYGVAAVPALMAGGSSNLSFVSQSGGTPLKGTPIKGMNSASLVGIGNGANGAVAAGGGGGSVGVATLVVTADTDDRLTASRAVGALRHLLDALAAAAGRGLGPGRFAGAALEPDEQEWLWRNKGLLILLKDVGIS